MIVSVLAKFTLLTDHGTHQLRHDSRQIDSVNLPRAFLPRLSTTPTEPQEENELQEKAKKIFTQL